MTSQARIARIAAWIVPLTVLLCSAAVTLAAAADHMLLSEVVVKERPGVPSYGSEYIEITNASSAEVDLSRVYLTDGNSSLNADTHYWRLVTGGGRGGGGTGGDFNARFPDGATLAPGASVTVSLRGSAAFQASYSRLPDYELFEDGATFDDVPDLVEAFPGSIGYGLGNGSTNVIPSTGWLDDTAETVVMYEWDGVSDLVADLDILNWGANTTQRVDKTGETVDGPDADATTSAYLADTAVGSQGTLATVHAYGQCFQRPDTDEGAEIATGGNGVTGHDETSEPFAATWNAAASPQDPTSTGTVVVAAPAVTATELSPASPQDGSPATVTATVPAPASNAVGSVTVRWRTTGAWTDVPATSAGGDDWTAQIPAQSAGTVVQWYATTAGVNGGESEWPHGAPLYVNSYTVQEVVIPGSGAVHLLLTEVCDQGAAQEFIEIYNPTDETVELDDYYLTDAVHLTGDTGDQGYWRLPEGNPSQSTIGGGAYYDFNAQFPVGSSIGPHETRTITVPGADSFETSYGVPPDFELYQPATANDVPEMREVFPGSIDDTANGGTAPTLTNGSTTNGEIVVLYYWDGVSQLVTDVDAFFWGNQPTALIDHSHCTLPYAPDTPPANQHPMTNLATFGSTYQRVDPAEDSEVQTGGNGVDGNDETSEDLNQSWQVADPTPGQFGAVAVAIAGATLAPIHPQPDEAAVVAVSVGGAATPDAVTLHYSLNGGAYTDVACTDNGDGTWSGTIPGQADGTVVNWFVTAAAGTDTAVWPEGGAAAAQTYTVQTFVPNEGLAKLLLTEICTQGTNQEFVEIANPNDFDVPLDNYYLTDAVHYASQAYWNLPAGNPTQASIGGGDYTDFEARFPADAVLAAGDTITIAIAGSGPFSSSWGSNPSYELFEDGDYADNVPDMREVFPGSINGTTTPTLSNAGEIVALYYWDGVSDLVTDIDIFVWGVPGADYTAVKNGVTIGSSTYNDEMGYTAENIWSDQAPAGSSYQRTDPSEGTQLTSGGNGVDGRDETSENFYSANSTHTFKIDVATPAVPPVPEGAGGVSLTVEARTFLPTLGEKFQIEFTATPGAETVLRIFDLDGRVVRNLYDSRFQGPVSTLPDAPSIAAWDGRNDVYELVKAGTYVVHLQVLDKQTGKRQEKTAPAVVATRLSN